MKNELTGLERSLASILSAGTALASLLITLGLMLPWFASAPSIVPRGLIAIGVATIIVLPILRVAFMAFSFFRVGDWILTIFAALVLAIIGVATFLGGGIG